MAKKKTAAKPKKAETKKAETKKAETKKPAGITPEEQKLKEFKNPIEFFGLIKIEFAEIPEELLNSEIKQFSSKLNFYKRETYNVDIEIENFGTIGVQNKTVFYMQLKDNKFINLDEII